MPTLGDVSKLDIGCGTGTRTAKYDGWIRKTGANLGSFGIDISDEMAKIATGHGVDVKIASMTNIPFQDSSFNLVTLIFGSIAHLNKNQFGEAFKEIYRVMNQGHFFLDASTAEVGGSYYTRKTYEQICGINLRKRLLKKRLAIKEYLGQNYLTYRGYHTDKVQSMYVFPRKYILSLARNAGFHLVENGKVTQRQLNYHYDGSEMFVFKK